MSRGLTLFELLAALAVLGICFSLAASGFIRLRTGDAMTHSINNLAHAVHAARQRSLTTGSDIAICPSHSGQQCDSDANWSEGWLSFDNRDNDNPPQRDPDETILYATDEPANLRVEANRRAFIFRPFGLRSTNGTFIFCDRHRRLRPRALIISYTGKPRTSGTLSNGATPCCAVS